jgi:hypothetical protein
VEERNRGLVNASAGGYRGEPGEYRGEADEHVVGNTRGTTEKYVKVHHNELNNDPPSPPTTTVDKGEGDIITFGGGGGLALKDGHQPEHYGVLDVNPDDLTVKRSMMEAEKRRIVTQLS